MQSAAASARRVASSAIRLSGVSEEASPASGAVRRHSPCYIRWVCRCHCTAPPGLRNCNRTGNFSERRTKTQKRFVRVTAAGLERNSRWLNWFGVGRGRGRWRSQAHQAAVTAADCAMNSGYVAHGASPSSSPPPPVGAGGGGGVVGVGGGGGRVGDWPLSLQASVPSSPIVPPVKKRRSPSKRPGLAWQRRRRMGRSRLAAAAATTPTQRRHNDGTQAAHIRRVEREQKTRVRTKTLPPDLEAELESDRGDRVQPEGRVPRNL